MRFLPFFLAIPALAATCDGLKSLAIPNTTVVSTQTSADVCKATFVAKPTTDSEIKSTKSDTPETLLPVVIKLWLAVQAS